MWKTQPDSCYEEALDQGLDWGRVKSITDHLDLASSPILKVLQHLADPYTLSSFFPRNILRLCVAHLEIHMKYVVVFKTLDVSSEGQ